MTTSENGQLINYGLILIWKFSTSSFKYLRLLLHQLPIPSEHTKFTKDPDIVPNYA